MIITDSLFSERIPEFLKNEKIFVVGLSGGADSLCLTMLLRQYSIELGIELIACFVDHKLRPESSTEILPIIDILRKYNIKYKVLVWNHPENIGGNIEKKAREARYKLLYDFCKTLDGRCLFVAHHKLDQWETFFMRLARGSSLKGLSCMKRISLNNDIYLIRPMLNFSPSDIKETLKNRFGIENYVCDSSNNQLRFERVRWRKSHETLAKEYGIGMENVNKTIERLQSANDCLNDMAYSISKEIFEEGYINITRFKALHEELKIRVLDFIIKSVFDKNNIISYSLLKRVSSKICEQYFSAINLSGVVLRRDKAKNVKVYRENRP